MRERRGGIAPTELNRFDPPFDVLAGQTICVPPVVFNSPHSGRIYPAEFVARSKLDPHALRRSEDYFVDEAVRRRRRCIWECHSLRANFPRAYLDVNREPYELDPMMFTDPLPDYVNTGSVRVAGGLGTIARVVSETEEIYR